VTEVADLTVLVAVGVARSCCNNHLPQKPAHPGLGLFEYGRARTHLAALRPKTATASA
jgi:hypothetical protein